MRLAQVQVGSQRVATALGLVRGVSPQMGAHALTATTLLLAVLSSLVCCEALFELLPQAAMIVVVAARLQ